MEKDNNEPKEPSPQSHVSSHHHHHHHQKEPKKDNNVVHVCIKILCPHQTPRIGLYFHFVHLFSRELPFHILFTHLGRCLPFSPLVIRASLGAKGFVSPRWNDASDSFVRMFGRSLIKFYGQRSMFLKWRAVRVEPRVLLPSELLPAWSTDFFFLLRRISYSSPEIRKYTWSQAGPLKSFPFHQSIHSRIHQAAGNFPYHQNIRRRFTRSLLEKILTGTKERNLKWNSRCNARSSLGRLNINHNSLPSTSD